MKTWRFETAYQYDNGKVYVVTLQHIFEDGVLAETLVIRKVAL